MITPLSAWVLALAQISQPQASICFVVASGEKPKYL